jgi:transposase-like protein
MKQKYLCKHNQYMDLFKSQLRHYLLGVQRVGLTMYSEISHIGHMIILKINKATQ